MCEFVNSCRTYPLPDQISIVPFCFLDQIVVGDGAEYISRNNMLCVEQRWEVESIQPFSRQ